MNVPEVRFDRDNCLITVHHPNGDLAIGRDNIALSHFSGGPGGQKVNKTMKGVQLRFTVPESHAVNAVRTRELIVRCINQRSLEQNTLQAFAQLAEKLRAYFYVKPRRRPTRPTRGSRETRLEVKKERGLKKINRRPPSIGDF